MPEISDLLAAAGLEGQPAQYSDEQLRLALEVAVKVGAVSSDAVLDELKSALAATGNDFDTALEQLSKTHKGGSQCQSVYLN